MPAKLDQSCSATASRKALSLFGLLLFSKQAYSLKELAEKLSCSRQTVLRLIEEVVATNRFKIKKWSEGGQNWYQAEVPTVRLNVAFSQEELTQLLLCRDFIQHLLPQGQQQYLESASQKAVCFLENNVDPNAVLTPVGHGSAKGVIDYGPFEQILEKLMQARAKLQVVDIEYLARLRTDPKLHSFVPVRFVSYHDGLYVRGWRVTDKGMPEILSPMMLALHRIQQLWATKRSLSRETALANPYPPESAYFGVSQQTAPFIVKVRFIPPSTTYVQERQWGAEQSIKQQVDGSLVLTFTAQSELEVVKWVLSFGREAELLDPEYLRMQVVQELSEAINRYVVGI